MTADACTVLVTASQGELMRLVADGLSALGFGVDLPECDDGCCLSVERWGRRCELSVSDCGIITWECIPRASHETSPKLTADIAAFLLTGKDHPRQDGAGDELAGMSFLGVTGNELRARGFDVGLEIYEDNQRFEVSADILVKNPVIHPTAKVYIGGDGAIVWECDYPYEAGVIADTPEYFAVLANTHGLADSIVARVAHAISLSYSAAAAAGNGPGEARIHD